MKKQDILNAMIEEAKRITKTYDEERKNCSHREWLMAISGLAAIEGIALRVFGYESEEGKEFNFYRKNFDKQLPQKEQVDA